MLRERLREGVAHIGQALREPEAFAVRWDQQKSPCGPWVFAALAATAMLGTTTYGMVMGIGLGPLAMLQRGFLCTTAAGIAWSLPLPALYVLNSMTGSRLRVSTTFLTALVTTSWGGFAMIASIPIAWFMSVALENVPLAVLATHVAVFTLVGVAMVDVFCRVIERLEPARGRAPGLWLVLVGAIGGELFYAFDLFRI